MAFDDLIYDDPSLQDDWFAQNAPADAWAGPKPISPGPTPPPGTTIEPNPEGGTSSPSPSPTAPAMSGGGLQYTGGDPIAWAQAQFATLPPTADSLIKIYDALKAAGVNVERPTHAGGTLLSDDKLTINGQMYDFIYNVGGSDAKWSFGKVGGDGGGTLGGGTFGSLLEPFTGAAPKPFEYPSFVAPTGAEALADDPGYLFRVEQGERALKQDKAARGLGLSGGTFKSILDYGQNAASQEYQNVFNRKAAGYGLNRDTATSVYDKAYNDYLQQYTAFRNRQRDTNQYLTDQQRIGTSTL